MPGIAEVLTRKLGPLPIWAWGGIGLGGAYLLYRSGVLKSLGVGSSSSTPTPPAPSGADTALLQQELGMLQQIQGFQGQQGPAPDQGKGTVTLGPTPGQSNTGIWSQNVAVYSAPNQTGQYQTIPFGVYHLAGSPQNNMYPIAGPGGSTVWALAQNVSGYQGVGGARNKRIPARSHAAMGGARPSLGAAHGIWRSGHPMLGGPRAAHAGPADVTHPHYAMGGARNATQVAAHMGIHPARVLAVNGHMKAGQARPGQIIRVV